MVISQSIFDLYSKTWQRFDQGKELFNMSIDLVHYTFYLKNEFLSLKIYQGPRQYQNESGVKKIPLKVWEIKVDTWSAVISRTIFGNDITWLPPP